MPSARPSPRSTITVAAAAALAALAAALGAPSQSQAAPIPTTTQYWDVFSDVDGGDNAPSDGFPATVDYANANGVPSVRYVGPAGEAFITSGGNIYSFSVPTAFETDVPLEGLGAGHETEVSLFIRTLGTALDYDDVRLTYTGDGGTETISFTSRETVASGEGMGASADSLFHFDVPFSPNEVVLQFEASGSSMSLDQVRIDTSTVAVPEPAGLALLALGIPLLVRRRRRC